MKVIPSALLLASGGIVVAQDEAVPVLISSTEVDNSGGSDPIPTQISFDPDDTPPVPELFDMDFDMSDFFGGAGDGGGADMSGDLEDLLSGLFGGGDAGSTTGGGDAQDMMFGDLSDMISGMFGGGNSDPDGQDTNILEELIGAGLSTSSGPFNLECPSSCDNPDLCQGDLMSVMMGGTDMLQAMCDTGCIPTIVLDACNPDATAAANAAFIASTGVCDFVNCCAVTEQEETEDAAAVAVSSTRAKFDECQEKLPDMADLFASTTGSPQDPTSDYGGFDMDFDMSGFQDMIEEIVDGFEEVLDQFGDSNMLSDMFASIFDSSSIPAFCAVDSCIDAPSGFCECFSGDLAKCSTEVISEACTTDAFSTCAPEGFTEFCSNECDQSDGSDILHMCAMCNVVTCCSKDNSEMEGCLSAAFEDHSQAIMADVDAMFSEFEDFLGGMDLEGMLTEILGDMESMQWCPDDKTCPLGPQFCEMANGGPSAADSDVAVSPRMDLQSFDLDLGSMAMDLDKMCADDMIFSCGPVDMKARCDSVCGDDNNDGIMKEAFCHVCGLAACCENGEDKTFSECSLAAYEPTDISATPDQDSTSEPPKEEPEVTNETNTASDGAPEVDFTEASPEGGTEPEAADLTPSQIQALENSRFEQENSGMTFSSVSFFTAMISTGLVLALY
jgi:hypothetical protein